MVGAGRGPVAVVAGPCGTEGLEDSGCVFVVLFDFGTLGGVAAGEGHPVYTGNPQNVLNRPGIIQGLHRKNGNFDILDQFFGKHAFILFVRIRFDALWDWDLGFCVGELEEADETFAVAVGFCLGVHGIEENAGIGHCVDILCFGF